MVIVPFLSLYLLIILMLVKHLLILRIRMFRARLLINLALSNRSTVSALSIRISSVKIRAIGTMSMRFTRMMNLSRKVFMSVGAVALALICVALPCFAATDEYNLVQPDVSLWNAIPLDGESARIVARGKDLVQFYFSSTPSGSLNVGGGYYQTIPSGFLISGHSYIATFSVPSGSQLKAIFGSADEQSAINTFINVCFPSNANRTLTFGVGTMDLSTNTYTPFSSSLEEQCIIDKDNIRDLIGKTISYSFVCPDYTGGTVVVNFGILQTQMPAVSQATYSIFMCRYVSLYDVAHKEDIDQFNRIWYGNVDGDYTNPYTTENYDVGDASDFDRVDDVFDRWEDGIDAVFRPLRVAGVFSNAIFSPSAIAWGATLVFLLLSFAFLFRLMGVT